MRIEHPVLLFGQRHRNAQLPRLPHELKRLFEQVPKTEEHMHLSGSTRKRDLRVFMAENGLTPEQIKDEFKSLRPHYDNLSDFLTVYYRLPKHVSTASQFKRATIGVIKDASRENVRILEIRSSILHKGSPPEELIQAVQEGMREGMAWVKKNRGYEMKTGLILLAQRAGTPEDSLRHAQLAVEAAKQPGSLVVGFDLAGDEIKHSLERHAPAIQYIKTHGKPVGVKLTIHAGEVPHSEGLSGLESLKKALHYGADRIGHGLQADVDAETQALLQNQQTALELCPWSNVQLHSVKNYPSHPIRKFLEKGLNVSLNTDNRLVNLTTLTRQLGQLWQHRLITSWDQVKRLTLNGVQSSFIPETDRKRVEQDVNTTFTQLEKRFKGTIKRYLTEKPNAQQSA